MRALSAPLYLSAFLRIHVHYELSHAPSLHIHSAISAFLFIHFHSNAYTTPSFWKASFKTHCISFQFICNRCITIDCILMHVIAFGSRCILSMCHYGCIWQFRCILVHCVAFLSKCLLLHSKLTLHSSSFFRMTRRLHSSSNAFHVIWHTSQTCLHVLSIFMHLMSFWKALHSTAFEYRTQSQVP